MKLHAGNNVIEKSGTFEESKFSIEASSKAFFILSDGLYSNKILAVVRELSTNAYDSHVEAGKKNQPFDVHIPTALNPVFFIRDYGTGMNHEDCMQLYTTYFRSTRNNSNDAVGCLGLGSKAPFAYADSFTVEAYLDGTKRVYNAYKNEDGSPVFSLMDTFNTDEPNGIKVSIQVNTNDIHRFKNEATKVYEFFNVKPNFVGEQLKFNHPAKILSGTNWYFDDNAHDNLIVMGQIAYPIDYYQLMGDGENHVAKFLQDSNGLRMFVNIGDVDITPSRESLSYSKDTKINIKNMINTIATEISHKIEDQIKNQTSLFKARMAYVQISEQCDSIKCAIDALQQSLKWNDIQLFDNMVTEGVNIKNKLSVMLLNKTYYRKKIDTIRDSDMIHFKSSTKFFIDDLPRGGLSRIKQHMREAYSETQQSYYVYKLVDGETVNNNKFCDIMGGATIEDVKLTSSLPKVEYNRQSSGSFSDGGPAVQIQMFNEETGQFEPCNMSVKYENAHYFMESKDDVQIGSYTETTTDYLRGVLAYVHDKYSDYVDGMTFYLVKPFVIKNRKLDERDNWFDGRKVLQQVFADAIDKHKEDVILAHGRMPLSEQRFDRWNNILEMTQTDNEAKKIMYEHKEYCKRIDSIASEMHLIQTMAQKLDNVNPVDLSKHKIKNQFSHRFDNEMKKYPMLRFATHVWSDGDSKIVADYIDNIEKSSTKELTTL